MDLQIDLYGFTYDADTAPAFVDAGDLLWFHRPTSKLLTKASIAAKAAAEGHAMSAKEAGKATAWLKDQTGIDDSIGVPAAKPPIPPTGVAATAQNVPGQTPNLQLSTGGATINAAGTVTIVFSVDGAADVTAAVAIASGDTDHQICVKVAAAPEWAANAVTATAAGSRVNLDAGAGKSITKLTVAVA